MLTNSPPPPPTRCPSPSSPSWSSSPTSAPTPGQPSPPHRTAPHRPPPVHHPPPPRAISPLQSKTMQLVRYALRDQSRTKLLIMALQVRVGLGWAAWRGGAWRLSCVDACMHTSSMSPSILCDPSTLPHMRPPAPIHPSIL